MNSCHACASANCCRATTSWHVGGPADIFFMPRDRADLVAFLKVLPPAVRCCGWALAATCWCATVVCAASWYRRAMRWLRWNVAGERGVYAEAGVPCAKLARQCARWDLGPAEFFSGIPGTLGGALAMNAGAFDGETWRQVRSVETIDRHVPCACAMPANTPCATGTWMRLPTTNGSWRRTWSSKPVPRKPPPALLERRKQTQPIGEWSCGSVFTNPPGDHAARLIETAGLKGLRIGGAVCPPSTPISS